MLAPLSNDEIAAAKTYWEAKNDESLVDKLNSEIRGGLRELIVNLLTGKRDEGEEADEVRVLISEGIATSPVGAVSQMPIKSMLRRALKRGMRGAPGRRAQPLSGVIDCSRLPLWAGWLDES